MCEHLNLRDYKKYIVQNYSHKLKRPVLIALIKAGSKSAIDDVLRENLSKNQFQTVNISHSAEKCNEVNDYKINLLMNLPEDISFFIRTIIIRSKTKEEISSFLEQQLPGGLKDELYFAGLLVSHKNNLDISKCPHGIYFDRTVCSVRPIYTPMGNKR